MPITNKKGAIFAIYADSPSHPTTSSSRLATQSDSPVKRPTSRKALTAIQPKVIKGFPSSSAKSDSNEKGKTTPKSSSTSVNPKPVQPRVSSASRRQVPVPPPRSAPSKRQLEIFSSSSVSSPPLVSHPSPSAASRPAANGSSAETPAKRGRLTPVQSRVDKENQPPLSASDSPASRTRARTRARADSLVGDERGTLTLRKGRAIATLLAEENAAGSSMSITGIVVGFEQRSPETSGRRRSEGKGKGGSGLEVRPLADVSEAYGASGAEPEGFRDVPRWERKR